MSKAKPRVNAKQAAREARRQRIAAHRKDALVALGLVYNDIARLAGVTYSMADKWANGRRSSVGCDDAFRRLTGGLPPYPLDDDPTATQPRTKAG